MKPRRKRHMMYTPDTLLFIRHIAVQIFKFPIINDEHQIQIFHHANQCSIVEFSLLFSDLCLLRHRSSAYSPFSNFIFTVRNSEMCYIVCAVSRYPSLTFFFYQRPKNLFLISNFRVKCAVFRMFKIWILDIFVHIFTVFNKRLLFFTSLS